jgi:hypothetical protein
MNDTMEKIGFVDLHWKVEDGVVRNISAELTSEIAYANRKIMNRWAGGGGFECVQEAIDYIGSWARSRQMSISYDDAAAQAMDGKKFHYVIIDIYK